VPKQLDTGIYHKDAQFLKFTNEGQVQWLTSIFPVTRDGSSKPDVNSRPVQEESPSQAEHESTCL
jgi:hypothetical protein